MNLGLQGKTAIILAASKGLGKASALALALEGANVVIAARDKTILQQAAEEIKQKSGSNILAVPCDVTNLNDLKNLITKTVEEFKAIDIIVNNAGGPPSGKFESFTDEQWQQAFELNLLSAVKVIRLALPYLKKSKAGRIINMVSIAAKQPTKDLILSNSIRAGVLGMAKTLADEFAPDNITVNSICTGYFLTDRIKHLYIDEKVEQGMSEEEAFDYTVKNIPLKRFGKPEEFGALVAFLASDQAAYITGTSIQIDGGLIRSLF